MYSAPGLLERPTEMASLLADKTGRLLVQFYYRKTLCREYLGLSDTKLERRKAARRASEIELALKVGTFDYAAQFPNSPRRHQFVGSVPPTLGAYARRWLEVLEVSRATKRDLGYLFNAYIDRTPIGTKHLHEVTAADIREIVKAATEKGRQRRVVMFVQRIKTIFESAIEDGVVTKNPAARIKNPKPINRPETVEPFTGPEISRLLEAAKGEDRNFIAILVGTGLRPGELLALRPKDIDLERRKITVSGSVGRFGEGPTKTRRVRVIDATDAVAPVIPALIQQRHYNRIPRLFRFDFTNWRSRNWKQIVERADVSYRSPYALRHTFAVRMLVLRFDPVYIAGQLGHTSTEMLHRHYARWAIGAPVEATSNVP